MSGGKLSLAFAELRCQGSGRAAVRGDGAGRAGRWRAPRTGLGRAGDTRVREAGPGLCRLATIRLPWQHEEPVKPV